MGINDINLQRETAVQAVGGAGESGVIGAHRHLHPVE